jgi:hypothetical protein
LKTVGIELQAPQSPALSQLVALRPVSDIHRAIERRIAEFDFVAVAQRSIGDALDRSRGQV